MSDIFAAAIVIAACNLAGAMAVRTIGSRYRVAALTATAIAVMVIALMAGVQAAIETISP